MAIRSSVLGGTAFEEFLVVAVVVLFVEAGRETKVSKFDVAAAIQENIIRFYITGGKVNWCSVTIKMERLRQIPKPK